MKRQAICIFVYQPGAHEAIPAAEFRIIDEAHAQIVYFREYLADTSLLPIDPIAIPRLRGPIILESDKLGAIRDALPDFWGRQVIARYLGADLRDLDDFALLMETVAFETRGLNLIDRVGNLDFRASESSKEPLFLPPAYATLEDLHQEVIACEAEAHKKGLSPLLLEGSSLGGARPKCTILHNDRLWVAKFPSRHDMWNNARVEMATMRLASMCGICVPDMELATIATGDVLLVNRFDRVPVGQGKYARTGYMSGLSLLGIDERERGKYSYTGIADRMRTVPCQASDRIELYRRMVFNVLVRNIDDHPRNFGFLTDGQRIRLSPAFDITPTVSRPGVDTEPRQAMAVSPRGRLGSVGNLLEAPERFGLSRSEASDMIQGMFATLAQWREVFAHCGVPEEDTAKFENTFATRWETEPLFRQAACR